jgi:cell wall-associated NlpC family hydrolase
MLLHGDWRSRVLVATVAGAIVFAALPSASAQPRKAVMEEAVTVKAPSKTKRRSSRGGAPGFTLHATPWRFTKRQPSKADIVLAVARAQLGKPYVWAATGPDAFDCSGLTRYAWEAAGVELSHNSYAQQDETTAVPVNQMKPGDLVFYPGHVGIYIGHGQMIHAPHTGASVEVAPLMSDIIGAGRPAA